MVEEVDLVKLLPPGHSVGSIRTRKPSMYIFSGGNEDAAFFSVNGFSVLIDGGDKTDVPYWNLIRNYDKISAAVVTRISPNCLRGIAAILMRKCLQQCHPNFGAVICNLPPVNVASGDSEAAKVLRAMHDGLHAECLKPIEAFASSKIEPITLYEVIGEGALRMIVLNPEKGSKEITALANAFKSGENIEKHAAATSLALILVWHPADHTKPVTRVLVTGACPLEKLYASLEKLKGEDYLRHPEYIVANSKEKSHTGAAGNVRLTVGNPINKTRKPTAPPTSGGMSRPAAPRPTAAHGLKVQPTEQPTKKVVSQPTHGARISRSFGGSKKPAQPSKTSTTSGRTPGDSRPKPGVDNKGSAHERFGQSARTKPVVKNQIKHGNNGQKAEKAKDDNNVSTAVPRSSPSDVSKTPPSGDGPSLPASPHAPKSPKVAEGTVDVSESPESGAPHISKTSKAQPHPVEDHDLLDDLEKPMQTHIAPSLNLLDTSVPQDTPLLDSTPVSASAPMALEHLSPQSVEHSSQASGEDVDEDISEDERLARRHKKSMQELLGSGGCPFTTGLASSIVDDAAEIAQLAAQVRNQDIDHHNRNEIGCTKLEEPSIHSECEQVVEQKDKTKLTVGRETYAVRSDVSSDSVNAAPDPALDEVIDSLADASEQIDNEDVRGTENGKNKPVGENLNDTKEAAEDAEKNLDESNKTPKSNLGEDHTHVAHDFNDNADPLAAQHTYEEMHAREMYLPPMTSVARSRTNPTTNGAKAKPKLSQPFYFDIVFVPHHGIHPALKDEETARAFVTSIRSRRYILSGQDAIRTHFIDGLIAGKNSWNKPELEVDILPTHDSDELIVYSHQNMNEMAEAGINLRCSVERCTLRLSSGGSDDVCAAFKFEM